MRMTRQQARKLGLVPGNGDGRKKAHEQKAAHALFDAACAAHGLPIPVHEYEFWPGRKFRFDVLFEGWLALEIQGGLWVGGRHVRGAALREEHAKLNEAVILGYSVLFCEPADVQSGAVFALVKRALGESEVRP